MSESLKEKATKGLVWSAIERFSAQSIQFITMIIMARILAPKDYGIIGMLSIFLAVSQSLIDSGFSQALIRKQDRTDIDNSTVFYFNVIVSIALYITLYVSAPYVSIFYNTPELCSVMRIVCLCIIINSLSFIQRTILTIKFDFKNQAKISFIATLISGVIGISLAYNGFGVNALVIQSLSIATITTFLFWCFSKWRPLKTYSWKSFHELFGFGSKLMFVGIIDTIYNNIYSIIIGKLFSASTLGYYTRANNFSEFSATNITGILQRVTYPLLCELQSDETKLASIYKRILKLSAFIIFPIMTGLAAIAFPFINIVLGEKWSFTANILQIICFCSMLYPIHAINLNLLKVIGKSGLFLKLEIIKKIILTIILVITIPFGLITMCYGQIISSILCLTINTYYTGKFIKLGFFKQIKDLLPSIILSISMFIIVNIFTNLTYLTNIQKLIGGITIGLIYYTGTAYLFKFQEFKDLRLFLGKKKNTL